MLTLLVESALLLMNVLRDTSGIIRNVSVCLNALRSPALKTKFGILFHVLVCLNVPAKDPVGQGNIMITKLAVVNTHRSPPPANQPHAKKAITGLRICANAFSMTRNRYKHSYCHPMFYELDVDLLMIYDLLVIGDPFVFRSIF